MRLFGFNITRKASPLSDYALSDDDREASKEVRKLKAEQRKLTEELKLEKLRAQVDKERWEIEQLKAELYGDDEEEEPNTTEQMLIPLLMGAFRQPQQQTSDGLPVQSVSKVTYSDQEIGQLIQQIPAKYRKQACKLPESTLKKLIIGYQPNIADETADRAVKLLKTG